MRAPAIAAAVLAAGCYRGEAKPKPAPPAKPAKVSRAVRTAPDPLGFLPIDAELVAQVDLDQVRQSSMWARFEPSLMAKAEPTLAQFRTMCGFDPLMAMRRIAIGLRGLDTPELGGVLVIRGIERAQLMPCIDKALAQQPNVGTIERGIVTLRTEPTEPPIVFAYADSRTLVAVAGHGASVQVLRDTLDGGAPLRASEAFMAMYGRIDPRRAGWFFLNGNAKLLGKSASLGIKPRGVFGSADLASGFAAKIVLQTAAPADAQTLVTMLQGQLPAVQAMVAKFEVTAEDADVVFDVALTDDQLALFASLIP